MDTEHTGFIRSEDLPTILRRCCDQKNKSCSEEDINRMVSRFHPDSTGRIAEEDFLNTVEELRKECESECNESSPQSKECQEKMRKEQECMEKKRKEEECRKN